MNAPVLNCPRRVISVSLRSSPDTAGNKSAAQRKEESIRSALENKSYLRVTKRLVNGLLNLFQLGDSMKAYYVKPGAIKGN